MKQIVLVVVLMLCGSVAHAQHPYSVTRAFGSDVWPGIFYAQGIDGTISFLMIDAPDFVAFSGSDFDRPRNRVVLIATETASARLISVSPSLDEGSIVNLRTGLDVSAQGVHVDPDTGRIYWWENDEILSVSSDGTGTPIVEADNVPEPDDDMDIDSDRGFYAIVSSDELMIGDLDGVGSASPVLIPRQMTGGGQVGVGIDPVSGDVYWTEVYNAGGLNGAASAVYRVEHTNPLGAVDLMFGTEDLFLGLVPMYQDVAVIGDQLAASSMTALLQGQTLTILNTTTNQIVDVFTPSVVIGISIDFHVDPIINQPVGQIVNQGATGALEVGPSDALSTYQWYRNGSPVIEDGRVSGVTTNKLVIDDAMGSDTDTYACAVTTSGGEQQLSEAVVFAVRGSQEPFCDADLNGDGEVNFFDVSVFLSAYNMGCP
jgi:hypothetical protein